MSFVVKFMLFASLSAILKVNFRPLGFKFECDLNLTVCSPNLNKKPTFNAA